MEFLAVMGAVFLGSCGVCLLVWFGIWFKRLCRVVHDYHVSAPTLEDMRPWGESNYFKRLQDGLTNTKNRLYIAERNSSNAVYRIGCHVKDNKHTLTPYAKKLKEEREEIAKDDNHDRDIRGCGDGM